LYKFDMSISSAVSTADGGEAAAVGPLSSMLLEQTQRYWHAANFLTVAQIDLQDNPLLREPLRPEHVKPRLLGHWGTSPGLSLIYIHLNRLIKERDVNVIYLAGPGHGGPALVGHAYLEGTYSEV
jgi:xylulose-5-phosphate/fructose-6-phosphate phosphoketolase